MYKRKKSCVATDCVSIDFKLTFRSAFKKSHFAVFFPSEEAHFCRILSEHSVGSESFQNTFNHFYFIRFWSDTKVFKPYFLLVTFIHTYYQLWITKQTVLFWSICTLMSIFYDVYIVCFISVPELFFKFYSSTFLIWSKNVLNSDVNSCFHSNHFFSLV